MPNGRSVNVPELERTIYREVLAKINDATGDPQVVAEAAEAEEAELKAEISALKAKAKTVKREIADWKAWYDALPEERAPDEIGKMRASIDRLVEVLTATEAEISALHPLHSERQGVAIALRARADAIEEEGPEADQELEKMLRQDLQRMGRKKTTGKSSKKAKRTTKGKTR